MVPSVASRTAQHHPGAPPARSELHPLTLSLASLASVVATVVLSRFGLAGTLLGAALAPLILAVVKELGRRPAEVIISRAPVPRDGRLPRAADAPPRPRARRPSMRWGVVAATTAIAVAVSVAAVTVPEIIAGRAVVADRPTTFFSTGSGGGDDGAPAPATHREDEERPAATTTTAPTETEPAVTEPTVTEPTVTEPTVTEPTDTAPGATTAPPPDPGAAPAATDPPATPVLPAPPAATGPEEAPPAP